MEEDRYNPFKDSELQQLVTAKIDGRTVLADEFRLVTSIGSIISIARVREEPSDTCGRFHLSVVSKENKFHVACGLTEEALNALLSCGLSALQYHIEMTSEITP